MYFCVHMSPISAQNAFPARFKEAYVLHQPWFFSIIMALFRPFLSEKMKNRVSDTWNLFVHTFHTVLKCLSVGITTGLVLWNVLVGCDYGKGVCLCSYLVTGYTLWGKECVGMHVPRVWHLLRDCDLSLWTDKHAFRVWGTVSKECNFNNAMHCLHEHQLRHWHNGFTISVQSPTSFASWSWTLVFMITSSCQLPTRWKSDLHHSFATLHCLVCVSWARSKS